MNYNAKSVLIMVNASLRWLIMYIVQVSLLLIGQQGLGDSSGIGPRISFAGGLCKFYANAGGKVTHTAQPLMEQYKQQANLLLSMNNYTGTPLVISWNYKNKQPTLLSQRKFALTEGNSLFAL
jgi:hypothetical protein